jgi:hypothetical protein
MTLKGTGGNANQQTYGAVEKGLKQVCMETEPLDGEVEWRVFGATAAR